MDHQAKKGSRTTRRTEARQASRDAGTLLGAWLVKRRARRDAAAKRDAQAAALAGPSQAAHHPHNDRQAVLAGRQIVFAQETPGANREARRSRRQRHDRQWVEGRRVWPTPESSNTVYRAPRADSGGDHA